MAAMASPVRCAARLFNASATRQTKPTIARPVKLAGKLLADRSLSRLLKGDWPRSLEELGTAQGGRRQGRGNGAPAQPSPSASSRGPGRAGGRRHAFSVDWLVGDESLDEVVQPQQIVCAASNASSGLRGPACLRVAAWSDKFRPGARGT